MLLANDAYIEERAGSRVYIELNNVVLHLPVPHPQREIRKGAVESIRKFLVEAGMHP